MVAYQLGCQRRKAVQISLCPAVVNDEIATLGKSRLDQSTDEGRGEWEIWPLRHGSKIADYRDYWFLRKSSNWR